MYKKYITAGFFREDYEDDVVFNNTGNHPFYLEKEVNKNSYVYVNSDDLKHPILAIFMDSEKNGIHRVSLTVEQALDLVYLKR